MVTVRIAVSGVKASFKTALIAVELLAIIFMSGWLFTMYNTSTTARQAVDQLAHRAYLTRSLNKCPYSAVP